MEHKEMTYIDYKFVGSRDSIRFDEELSANNFFRHWGLRDGQYCRLRADENDHLVIEFIDSIGQAIWHATYHEDEWDAKQLDLF